MLPIQCHYKGSRTIAITITSSSASSIEVVVPVGVSGTLALTEPVLPVLEPVFPHSMRTWAKVSALLAPNARAPRAAPEEAAYD